MIVLPDEDEEPLGAQVNAVIGEALRQSVAEAELSPGFEARLAAALDGMGRDEGADHVGAAAGGGTDGAAGQAAQGAAGRGSEAAETAS